MKPTPESNEKMIKQNRMLINQLSRGGFESRDYAKRPDGTYGSSIVKGPKAPGFKGPGKPMVKPYKGK